MSKISPKSLLQSYLHKQTQPCSSKHFKIFKKFEKFKDLHYHASLSTKQKMDSVDNAFASSFSKNLLSHKERIERDMEKARKERAKSQKKLNFLRNKSQGTIESQIRRMGEVVKTMVSSRNSSAISLRRINKEQNQNVFITETNNSRS